MISLKLSGLKNNVARDQLRRLGSSRASREGIGDFKWFLPLQTRIKDNDVYGHVNNAVHHALFDTLINVYLIRHCGLDASLASRSVGFMVNNRCTYLKPISFPHVYVGGLSIARLGNSSVHYRVGLFQSEAHTPNVTPPLDPSRGHFSSDLDLAVYDVDPLCLGEYTHVFVDPGHGNTPKRIDDTLRAGLNKLLV